MKKLKILFVEVSLRMRHYYYSTSTTFALLTGLLKRNCPQEVDTIEIIDGNIKFIDTHDLIQVLDDYRPDIIGLRCFSYNHKLLIDFVTIIKEHNPFTKIIVGGPHATLTYEELVKDKNIDFLVIGEGEETICELTKAIFYNEKDFRKINGIAYNENGNMIITPPRSYCANLSEVYSHFDHDSINYDDYEGLISTVLTTGKDAHIMTSRGCPYRCAYCHGLWGQKVRRRSVESVIDQIEHIIAKKNIQYFNIDDDIFNIDLIWAKEFARKIIARQLNIKISFYNGLRADQMDEELIDLLLHAGTYHFRFAVETASPRLQKLIRKNLNLKKTMQMIKYADKTSAIVDAFFMFGFPSETEEEVEETLSFIEETGLFHPLVNFLQISPHTDMQKIYDRYAVRKPEKVLTPETGGNYDRITDNGFCYSPEFLRNKFRELSLKTLGDPQKIAIAYKKLSDNIKENDVKLYFGLNYALPNIYGVTLNNLPNNELGNYLKKIAKESMPSVLKALGYTRN